MVPIGQTRFAGGLTFMLQVTPGQPIMQETLPSLLVAALVPITDDGLVQLEAHGLMPVQSFCAPLSHCSVPLFTPSPPFGAWQTPLVQTPLWQSEEAAQALRSAHFGQAGPPQSRSVSRLFCLPSVQVGTVPQMLFAHIFIWQSSFPLHALPSTHAVQLPPPQSVSVSVPFFTLSVQVGAAAHFPFGAHMSLKQSMLFVQAWPVPHLGQSAPPQSTSLSRPSFSWLLQEGGRASITISMRVSLCFMNIVVGSP